MKTFFKNTLFYLFICIFLFSTISFADDISSDEDDIDTINEIDSLTSEASTTPIDDLKINSRSYIVLDRKSNQIIVGKNEFQKRKMASTTKIMTFLVVLENIELNTTVEVSKKAAGTGGSRLGLKTGDKITIKDLLYGLMLCSGNDAAVCLAESVAGSVPEFANLMNKKAKDLNLTNTHFVTPHGLDEDEHYTTAYELALLTNYALNNETFAKYVGTKTATITINGYSKTINNTNELLGVLEGVYGVKTGFTNGANRCLVSACKRGDLDIICIVLGADTKKYRTQDSIKLIEYTFKNYTYFNINEYVNEQFNNWKNNESNDFIIIKGLYNKLDTSYSNINTPIIPIKKDDLNNISISFSKIAVLNAPIYQNSIVGNIEVSINKNVICTCDIIAKNYIPKKSCINYFFEILKNYSYYLNENIV